LKSKLHQRVLQTIANHPMLAAGDRVGVAVSGGSDSVALLRLFEDLRAPLGVSLCIAHLNHGLRGDASGQDEIFVSNLAREMDLPFLAAREDVAALARRNHWNLEDAGRRARYEFFERLVRDGKCNKVAVAHTADDQAETLLARIIRGTGSRGLIGIYPVRGAVIRPLLEVRREELREYLRVNNQTWREDATNIDTSRLRARLRYQLLPILERDFSSTIIERLTGLAAHLRNDEKFWQSLVKERLQALTTESRGKLSIEIPSLLAPLEFAAESGDSVRALSSRLILAMLGKIAASPTEFGSTHVRQVLRLASESQSGRRIELPHGVEVARVFNRLEFSRRTRDISGRGAAKIIPAAERHYEYALALPDTGPAAIDVPELGLRFCLKPIDWPSTASDTNHRTDALDADRLRPPLVLRNWRPGDACRLPGKRQAQKLKRMFAQARISSVERKNWPVLTSTGRVVWVRGWPPAADFSARKETRRRIVVGFEAL
jgi:tRNA(Ile)-lysidine synthase